MGYNLFIDGIRWGYNPLTNLLSKYMFMSLLGVCFCKKNIIQVIQAVTFGFPKVGGHVTSPLRSLSQNCRDSDSPFCDVDSDMGVSVNGGTPRSSNLIGFSIINHPFWGTPYFWKHPHGLSNKPDRMTDNDWHQILVMVCTAPMLFKKETPPQFDSCVFFPLE